VLDALKAGPLDPDAIRETVGSAARSLGAAGAKKGVTTTLPIALGLLQAHGEIRRIPVNGRLDQQRYKYAAWSAGSRSCRRKTPSPGSRGATSRGSARDARELRLVRRPWGEGGQRRGGPFEARLARRRFA